MSSLPVFLGRDEFPVGHCLAASPVAELEHRFYLPDLYPLGAGSSALRPPLPATRGPGFHCTSGDQSVKTSNPVDWLCSSSHHPKLHRSMLRKYLPGCIPSLKRSRHVYRGVPSESVPVWKSKVGSALLLGNCS